ncbi:hypothetical protein [Enterococcus sp. AZ072]|uniref:hypothetical protein n=1 Tax=unclassified Enterococcus TaxID=2608891 RepID=UPI003D284C49
MHIATQRNVPQNKIVFLKAGDDVNDKPDFSKQKIRGWKRRVRDIERWKAYYLYLDLDLLKKYDRDYVKLSSLSFYSLFRKYDLPTWYKRLIIQALIDVYNSWKHELEKLDEPYYLKVWIFEADILHSQVVASYKERLSFYDTTFVGIEKVKSLPEKFTAKNTSDLSWYKGFEVIVWSEVDLLEDISDGFYTVEEVQSIRDSAYSISETSEDTYYIHKGDAVWLGG